MPKINFFTCVDGRYEMFVVPFVYSHLINNEDTVSEIVVEDPAGFWSRNAAAKDLFDTLFPGRVVVRKFSDDWNRLGKVGGAATWRFLESPEVPAEYTYIGDADIFCTEADIYDHETRVFKALGLPYNNFNRPNSNRYTGCFAVKTNAYYGKVLPKVVGMLQEGSGISNGDEMVLFDIIAGTMPENGKDMISGLPVRKIHGIHTSPNRKDPLGVDNRAGWGINLRRAEAYGRMKGSESWSAFYGALQEDYAKNVLDVLEDGIARYKALGVTS